MATWGTWVSGSREGANQQNLQVMATMSPSTVEWDTNTVTVTVRYRTHQNLYSGDNQQLNITGTWSGTKSFYMPGSADATVNITTVTHTVSTKTSGSVTVSTNGNISGHYGGATPDVSASWTIPQRPQGISQLTTSVSSVNMGNSVTFYTNRADSSLHHTLWWVSGGNNIRIADDIQTSYTWAPPVATFAPKTPNSTSMSQSFRLSTYNSSGGFVGASYKSVTLKVPSSVIPSVGTVSLSDNTNGVSVTDKYVKGVSELAISATNSVGIYGSTISSRKVTFQGASTVVGTTSALSITTSGTQNVVFEVTDSRGRKASSTQSIDILDYAYPSSTLFQTARCESDGTPNQAGEYFKVTLSASAASLLNTTERNELLYSIFVRSKGTTSWGTAVVTQNPAGLSVNTVEHIIGGSYSAVEAFEIMLTIDDVFSSTSVTRVQGVAAVALSLGKSGIGVGKVLENGTLDVAGDAYFSGNIFGSLTGTDITSSFTADSSITVSDVKILLYLNKLVSFYLKFSVATTAPSNGNVPDFTVGTIATQYSPISQIPIVAISGTRGSLYLRFDGTDLKAVSGTPDTSFVTTDSLHAYAMFSLE